LIFDIKYVKERNMELDFRKPFSGKIIRTKIMAKLKSFQLGIVGTVFF
jgi:hypothetical protein